MPSLALPVGAVVLFAGTTGATGVADHLQLFGLKNRMDLAVPQRLQLERSFAWSVQGQLEAIRSADWFEADGWDRPSDSTIRAAQNVIDAVAATHPDLTPHLVSSPDGEIVFEWWSGATKVTLYVSEHGHHFIKSWGADILEEMEEGTLASAEGVSSLLRWLRDVE